MTALARAIQPAASSGAYKVGDKIKAVRKAQGITLEQLALSSGVNKGSISRIENNESSPTVATLVSICEALSLQIGSLFEEPDIQLVHFDQAPHINLGGRNLQELLLTPRTEESVQIIRSILAPDSDSGEGLYTINSETEVLHVLSGEVTVEFRDKEFTLKERDTLTFPGKEPHAWRNSSNQQAEIMWILIPAAWSGTS